MSHFDSPFEANEVDSIGRNASDRVGITEKGSAKANNESVARSSGWRKRKSDLLSWKHEIPKGSARRKAREGEYEGSVRSLRTQQRAKSQRQI
ncbi:hypothetical protein, partial [Streptomyces sp. NPDC001415]